MSLSQSIPEITFISLEDFKDEFLEYEKDTRKFCESWISGQTEFEITTSGSTGKPKLISITRVQMQASTKQTAKAIDLKKGDVALVCINTHFIGGKMMLVRGLEIRMPLIIIPPIANPLKFLNESVRIDFTAMVPYQLQSILEESPDKINILNQMKAILLGGAPVGNQLAESIASLKCPVYSTYGMTETVSHIALKRLNGPERSDIFTTLPGIEIEVDTRNCLVIKGAVTNYTSLITNDVVKLINDRQFIWIGRSDNIINTGGIKIQIEELEKKVSNAFSQLNISNIFFISGEPDEAFGTIIEIFIEGTLKKNEKEKLEEIFKERLNKYEKPKKIIEVPKFDFTKSGKIDRVKTKSRVR